MESFHQYFITGTSRGIGKAIAELLLQDKNNRVTGFSRSCSIQHPNYHHMVMDMADVVKVSTIRFPELEKANTVTLINNAGTIGEVKHMGNTEAHAIVQNFNINLVAPIILTNAFIKSYRQLDASKLIINISSGAGKNPVDGWGAYCASKAGLDMFSKVVAAEQTLNSGRFKVFSIAPGVVDTQMQVEIRNGDKPNFSRLNDFVGYKENNILADVRTVAEKYIHIIKHQQEFTDVIFSVKDLA